MLEPAGYRGEELAARAINYSQSALHHAGFWIESSGAHRIASSGMTFIQAYAKLAKLCAEQRLLLFPILPKIHFLWHIYHQLRWESTFASWTVSPLATSVPMDEDFIGRYARLTRRVHPLRTIPASMFRYRVYLQQLLHDYRDAPNHACR